MANYVPLIKRAAKRHGVDPRVLVAQLRAESGLNPNAVGPATSSGHAQGIAQFIPATARTYGVNLNDGNPRDDIEGAAKMMAGLLKRFNGNYKLALAGYNAGPGAAQAALNSYPETQAYVQKILGGINHPGAVARPGGGGVRSHPTLDAMTGGGSQSVTIPGQSLADTRQQLKLQYLQNRHDPKAILTLALGLRQAQDSPSTTLSVPNAPKGGSGHAKGSTGAQKGKLPTGTANFEGTTVAAWIAPALKWAREHGWKGEVTSGYRSYDQQRAIYNSGVRPAAVPGTSNHEGDQYPRGAVDVDRADAQSLANILSKSPYAKLLKYAGAKDPVHFSHPHNGGY